MKVTYEEFFKDPKKYVTIAETEDLYLIKNSIIYLHLNNPCGDSGTVRPSDEPHS